MRLAALGRAGALAAAVALALAAPAAAARARAPVAWSVAFERPLAGWSAAGDQRPRRVASRAGRRLRLRGGPRGWLTHALPARHWALSLDVRPAPRALLQLRLGDRRHAISIRRLARGTIRVRASGRSRRLLAAANPPGGWLHLAAAADGRRLRVAVDRQRAELGGRPGRRLSLAVRSGVVQVDNILATALRDRRALLLHRLLELQARVPGRLFLLGAEPAGRLHLGTRGWWRGFLAGALWQADSLVRGDSPFAALALARTLANLGAEAEDTHDLGFIYEPSSVAAHSRLCARRGPPRPRLCARLRASGLAAADGLLALAATNPGGGTIPTRSAFPSTSVGDTIIDSLMNLSLLYWASRETGNRRYREVAARHARRVGELLVRPDGSSYQSAHSRRDSGLLLFRHTHQGIAPSSTWARGQGWAVYGLTSSAEALQDRWLLGLAERAAGYVAAHLPASRVPRYDYAAAPDAAPDVSAGVITAAGLLRLAGVCERRPGCRDRARWRPLGERMLAAALRGARSEPPLGYLGGQMNTYGGRVAWDDNAELSWGLYYALEAARLELGARR